MNVFTSVKRAYSLVRKSLSNPTEFEKAILGIRVAAAGIAVTPSVAMECSAVRACVQVIAETIGQLPVITYKKGDNGQKDRDPDNPLYAVLHDQATEWLSANEFRELVTRDALLHGNGYALIEKDGEEVTGLLRLDPDKMKVETDDYGEPVYAYTDEGEQKEYSFAEVLHIRAPSFDGYQGASIIRQARESIALAVVMERHAALLFKNGASPGGVIQHPNRLGDDVAERMSKSWLATHGGDNAGGVAVLEEGATYQPVGMTSEDAQFLEMRRQANEDISRFFRVPPIFINDYGRATWGNSDSQGMQLVTYCLMPWIKRWEGEIRLKLIPEDKRKAVTAEFLFEDLLRADTATRYEAYSKAIASEWMTPNEARARENLPRIEGGDVLRNPNTNTTVTPATTPEKVTA